MNHDFYEEIGKLYHTTLVDMFLPMDNDTALMTYAAVMETVDDIQLNTNWFIPSTNVIRTTLYNAIRSDMKVFSVLVKLERLMAFKLALTEVEEHFYKCLAKMFHLDGTEETVVDDDIDELLSQPSNVIYKQIAQVQRVPGLAGLLTAMQYRHIWASIKPQ